MNLFEQFLDELYKLKYLDLQIPDIENEKFEYIFENTSDKDILEMLAGINTKHVDKMFDENNELYGKLKNYMNKYKFCGWGDTFDSLAAACDVEMSKSTVSSLVNNIDRIEKMLVSFPEKNQTLTALVDCARAYNSSSKKYTNLIILINKKYG